MKRITFFALFFAIIFSFEYVSDRYSNGAPKIVRTYAGYSEIELTKEIGYYSNGIKKYEINYYDGKIKNTQAWTQGGKKTDFDNISIPKISKDNEPLKKADLNSIKGQIEDLENTLSKYSRTHEIKFDSIQLKLDEIYPKVDGLNMKINSKTKKIEQDISDIIDLFDSFKASTNENFIQIKNSINSHNVSSDNSDSYDDDNTSLSANNCFDEANPQSSTHRLPDDYKFISFDTSPKSRSGMRINPIYPSCCKQSAREGTVYVVFFIDRNGNVSRAYIKKGVTKHLDQAALDAVKASKWEPARQGLNPIGVWQTVPIRFEQ